MVTFSIRFLTEYVEGSVIGDAGLIGEIALDDYLEHFQSRVVNRRVNSCLITSLHDPSEIEVITWWVLYPIGRTVYVQDCLLPLDQQERRFSTRDP
jgi:hypothetical protein